MLQVCFLEHRQHALWCKIDSNLVVEVGGGPFRLKRRDLLRESLGRYE
jgi:hypothetical protein